MTAYNLARALERNADRFPAATAAVYGAQRLTHAELSRRVHALCNAIKSTGIGHGEVVSVLMKNSLDFLTCSFAINGAGAIFLPLNVRLSIDELCYILGHSGCRLLILDQDFLAGIPEIRRRCPQLRTVVAAGQESGTADVRLADLLTSHDWTSTSFADVAGSDVSRLMYTSGTTARPKGVPLTYENILWKIFDHTIELGLTASDRTLIAGPMYHVGAFDLPGVGTLYVGGSLVILPRFDAAEVMATIARESVTNVWLPPAMLNSIFQMEDPGAFDTSTLRFITNGGEKMPIALIELFRKIFPTAWLADSFGMTETASGDTFLDPEQMTRKLGSVGKPVLHLDVRILRPDGTEASPRESGELLLRGPKVFGGYWRDEQATREAFVDGWFRTGDIAHADEDGYLFIDDRKKDMIISGGENIASPEVERVLFSHPAVLEAAVIGIPDERWGEVPKAVVALKPGSTSDAEELIQFCGRHLARFKVPKVVEFVDALPRTPTGKVLKRDLR